MLGIKIGIGGLLGYYYFKKIIEFNCIYLDFFNMVIFLFFKSVLLELFEIVRRWLGFYF